MTYPRNMGDKQLFREDFLNKQAVVDNGGIIVGTPVIDKGATLDGIADYIDYLSYGASLSTEGTINFKITPTTVGTAVGGFLDVNDGTSNNRVSVYLGGGGATLFVAIIGDGVGTNVWAHTSATSILTNGIEQEITVVFDTVTDIYSLYIDGTLITPTSTSTAGNPVNMHQVRVGAFFDGTVFYAGGVKDVNILDTKWTQAEVTDEFENDTYTEVDLSKMPIHLPLISQYNDGSQKTKNIGTFSDSIIVGDGSTSTTYPAVKISPKLFNFDGGDYLKDSTADFRSSDTVGFVSAMIRLDSLAASAMVFSSSSEAVDDKYLQLGFLSSGAPSFIHRSGGDYDQIDPNFNLKIGRYYHVVYTTTGSAYKFYLDGVEASSYAVSHGTNDGLWLAGAADRDNVVIGATIRAVGITGQWNGDIKGVTYGDFQPTPRQVRWLRQRALKEFNL